MAAAHLRRQEVEPLSPRSTNIQYKARPQKQTSMKEDIQETSDEEAKKAEAARRAAKEKEYAPPPPDWVIQPPVAKDGLIEKYRTGRLLGKGGFALAYEGGLRSKDSPLNKHVFALKVVRSRMSQKKMEEKFRTELQIHAKMSHPNIVEFHRAFTYQDCTYVVLEMCPNGSVMDMVKKRKFLTLPEVRRLTVQLCGAIKYMHARSVIHRDLKMGNLFLDHDMNLKIGDFGLAAVLVSKDEYEGIFDYAKSRRTTLCGTPNYIAPEILEKGKGGHDHKVDIWAIGVILFAMLAGQPPFQSTSQHEIYKRARNVEYSWPEESKRGNDIPDEAKDLVARLLKVDAERRPDPDQIIGHRFFSMNGGDAIPAHMEGYFRTETPRYLDRQARPRGDVILPGTERLSLRTLAKDCGVGCLPGDLAPQSAVGADMDLSLYKECATEEAAGLGPVVPLPEDVVYTSKYSLRTWLPKQIEEVRKVDPRLYERTEEAIDPLARPKAKFVHDNPMANLEKARRAPVQSHAATLRAAHIRKPSNPRSELQPPAVERNELNTKANTIGSNRARRGLMNELPVRPLSSANTVTGQSTDAPERKSRTTRSKQVVVLDEEPNPSEGKTAHPMTKDQYVDATSPDPDRKRREMAAKTRARIASNVQKELAVDVEGKGMAKAPTARRQRSKPHTTTLIDPNEAFKFVPNTKPEDVMRTLSEMHTRLDKSLQRTQQQNHYSNVRAIEAKSSTFKQRPVVVKWVDYTNKYGIGFILANGTVGCLFKGEKTTLPTSIVVADSERHFSNRRLSSYAEKQSILSSHSLPVEYVEDTGAEGLKRVLCPPLKMQNLVSPSLTEPERSDLDASSFDLEKRRNLLLWDKFGRYMTQSLGHPEGEPEAAPTTRKRSNTATSATLFVKFYQRLGNVGIWGFSDSSFQFNFPDHTKLLLSPSPSSSAIDDLWADFYHLPIPAAKKLSAGQKIDPHDLAERGVLCYPVPIMLSGKLERRDFADVLHANQFERKLEFVRDLLAVWVSEGGIGCMGEKRGWRWEGMSEESGKSVWVTVGAKGGMRGMRGSDRGGKGGGGIGGSGWKVPGRGACMIIRSIFRCLDERCLVLGWTSVGVWGCLEF